MSSVVCQAFTDSLVPPEPMSQRDWLLERFYFHNGQAFDETRVPWVTAPQGPCWAFDNPQFNEIWLQWAARMGKTNFALSTLMRRADLDPCEMMFATPDETNCKTVFKRWWQMFENCPTLRSQCPSERMQSKLQIDLKRATVYGAWPRGKSRLADKSIPAGVANEIDKWEHASTSTEGDPLPRFLKRGAEYPDRKFVLESTPGTKGKSRVESGRLQSTNHQFYFPCPHCFMFQVIRFGDGKTPGGIFWDKTEDGTTDRQLAEETAHYVCQFCEGRIDDIHRSEMVNRGVWCPAGCDIDHERAMTARELPPDDTSWLLKEPLVNGNRYGSQISVFYALFHGWGQIVADFLAKKKKLQDFRQWTNEDKAETWELFSRQQTWKQLGDRIIVNTPRHIIPSWASMVTVGVDKQKEFYVYVVDAWGPAQQSHTMDYGTVDNLEEFAVSILGKSYQHEDGGEPLQPLITLIDSGYRPRSVYDFCAISQQNGQHVYPCKGSSKAMLCEVQESILGKGTSAPGTRIFIVDTYRSQDWMDESINTRRPGDQLSSSLFLGTPYEHQDFLQQILNDAAVQDTDTSNNNRESWKRIDESFPNDVRDCRRYSRAAMLIATDGSGVVLPRNNLHSLQSRRGR